MHEIEATYTAAPPPPAAAVTAHTLNASSAPLVSARETSSLQRAAKRALDLCLASVGLLLLAPLMTLVAALIKLDSPGPVIFRQRRVGKDGKPFVFLKFRTMLDGNDPSIHREYVKKLMRDCTDELKGANGSFKIERDPRVTRVGRYLRRASLDELPQLANVLQGHMSICGPRPPVEYEAELYTDRERRRLEVLPGITGWWQVCGRCETTFDEMIDLDLEYVDTWSVRKDIKIIARTFAVVLDRKGAW